VEAEFRAVPTTDAKMVVEKFREKYEGSHGGVREPAVGA
jgi:hypothetical protein